jgi:hypothetical protein
MTYYDMLQQGSSYNPQQTGQFGPQFGQIYGTPLGINAAPLHAAYGQPYGQYGMQPGTGAFGYNAGGWGGQWGAQPQWSGLPQRQLSQQDVNELVRQLLPALPQIIAQAQQPHPALANAAFSPMSRTLSQQDVNDVVRQLLPLLPQIVGALQGPQLQHLAIHGGAGGWNQYQNPSAAFQQQPYQQPFQQPYQQSWLSQFGQFGAPQFQSAFGNSQPWAQQWGQPQRQLSQQDVTEVTRQLVGLIPQVISSLQAVNQQRMN